MCGIITADGGLKVLTSIAVLMLKGKFTPKMTMSFTHSNVVPNLYDFVSFFFRVENKNGFPLTFIV